MVALCLLVAGVWNGEITPCFDYVEVNTVVCGEGDETSPRFTQIIAWTWCPSLNQFRCDGYRVVDSWRRTPRGVRYLEGSKLEWSEVNGDVVRVTNTRHDPEMADRSKFPIECRLWK